MGVPAVSSGRMPAMGIPILMMTRESNDEGLTRGELHYIHGPGRPSTLEMERAPNDESRGLSGEMRTGTRASISRRESMEESKETDQLSPSSNIAEGAPTSSRVTATLIPVHPPPEPPPEQRYLTAEQEVMRLMSLGRGYVRVDVARERECKG